MANDNSRGSPGLWGSLPGGSSARQHGDARQHRYDHSGCKPSRQRLRQIRNQWAFAVDWRQTAVQEVTSGQIAFTFGESEWAKRFEGLGYSPMLSFYSPSGVGQIIQHIGDSAYNPSGV
jgi:hypothetical protein